MIKGMNDATVLSETVMAGSLFEVRNSWLSSLTGTDARLLEAFATPLRDNEETTILRARRNRAGRFLIGGRSFDLLHRIDFKTLVTMSMYGTSGFIDKFVFNQSHDAQVQLSDENYADFLTSILVEESSRVAKSHIYNAYLPKRSQLQTLKGTVNWISFMQRPFPMGVECDHFELTSDILENQIVLAALVRARSFRLTSPSVRRRLAEQHFLWAGICRERVIDTADFADVANRRNRLNVKYESVHAISKLVLQGSFGFDRAGSATKLQSIWIDVPNAFERFLEQLLIRAAERFGTVVVPQETNDRSLIDARGNTYSKTRPDLLLKRGNVILAVVDAKAKPQYVAGSKDGQPESLVTNADIFQLFFYLREAQRTPGNEGAKAFIIVPDEGLGAISERYRRISWGADSTAESATLTLCSLDCAQVLSQIASGRKEWEIVQDSLPEIAGLIDSRQEGP